jgi:hypothetical protein
MSDKKKQGIYSEDWKERLNAYKELGFPEEAFRDTDRYIRLKAYRATGFTERALLDPYDWIRREAEEYLGFMKSVALEDAPLYINDDNTPIALAAQHMIEGRPGK